MLTRAIPDGAECNWAWPASVSPQVALARQFAQYSRRFSPYLRFVESLMAKMDCGGRPASLKSISKTVRWMLWKKSADGLSLAASDREAEADRAAAPISGCGLRA